MEEAFQQRKLNSENTELNGVHLNGGPMLEGAWLLAGPSTHVTVLLSQATLIMNRLTMPSALRLVSHLLQELVLPVRLLF